MFCFKDMTPVQIVNYLLWYFNGSWEMVKELIMSDSHHSDVEKATLIAAGFTILYKAYGL